MNILLLGLLEDVHIKELMAKLAEYHVNITFIDINKNFSDIFYKFNIYQNDICVNNIPIKNYNAIYWRYFPDVNLPDKAYSIRDLCEQQEILNFFLPLSGLSGLKCINPMLSLIKMENKIFQLDLATKCGFHIPATLVGCNHIDIIDFFEKEGQCIEKNLGLSWDENNIPSRTRKIDIQNISAKKTYPYIYQRFIKRKTEIRIYVIGKNIIPIEISLSKETIDIADWRKAASSILPKYKLYKLSTNNQKRLLKYQKLANLVYAAYDFIVNETGDEIFLECNPTGNWQFLPSTYANYITEALAKELTNQYLE